MEKDIDYAGSLKLLRILSGEEEIPGPDIDKIDTTGGKIFIEPYKQSRILEREFIMRNEYSYRMYVIEGENGLEVTPYRKGIENNHRILVLSSSSLLERSEHPKLYPARNKKMTEERFREFVECIVEESGAKTLEEITISRRPDISGTVRSYPET